MTNTEPASAESHRSSRLRLLAAKRTSTWFGYFFAIASATLGLLAVALAVSGIRASLTLPNTPRPGVGPGFSEAATQLFGSFIVGGWLAFASVIALVIAYVHSTNRWRTSLFAIPVFIFFVVVVATVRFAKA